MEREDLTRDGQSHVIPMVLWALTISIIGSGLVAAMVFFDMQSFAGQSIFGKPLARKLTAYANLLLIAASVLYVAHFWLSARSLQLWATALTAVGALGLIAGLVVRSTGADPWFLVGQPEVLSSFSAGTVVIYLVMERIYRTRRAGAFVMPIVAVAVFFEAWLEASSHTAPEGQISHLQDYLTHAHALIFMLGYVAFALAAAAGSVFLLKQAIENHHPASACGWLHMSDFAGIERLMRHTILVAFSSFSVALMLEITSANSSAKRGWHSEPSWLLIDWAIFAGCFYLHKKSKLPGATKAWWTLLAFGFSAICLLAGKLYWRMLHSSG